jgi:superfamily I DNA/RNA helicase
MEALLEGGAGPHSDFLIVDEIQDIATDPYLDVLDLLVEGGLKEGRVLVFGDFERQAIFENEPGHERLRARTPHMASHRLVQNCRNLPRIGYQVNLLSRLQPGYQHFRRADDGVDPTFHRYRAEQDQSALLASAIRGLKEEGYALNEIAVLSPLRDRSTAASTGDAWLRQILKPANGLPAPPGQVQFTTIHSFKGLEAPAVVVTDLDRETTEGRFDSLLYVGLTRATDRLIALIEASTLRNAVGGAA